MGWKTHNVPQASSSLPRGSLLTSSNTNSTSINNRNISATPDDYSAIKTSRIIRPSNYSSNYMVPLTNVTNTQVI